MHSWLKEINLNKSKRFGVLWKHFPVDEFNFRKFAEITIEFHKSYKFELTKVTPSSAVWIRDFGCLDHLSDDVYGIAHYATAITQSRQWRHLSALPPKIGVLGQYLSSIEKIKFSFADGQVVIPTVFSPLSQAVNLSSVELLLHHIIDDPQSVVFGLEILYSRILNFINEISDSIDGIFYVVKECEFLNRFPSWFVNHIHQMNKSILRLPKDKISILHLHGVINDFGIYCDYPASILHWHERESGIDLLEGKKRFPGIVCGGLNWPKEGWVDKSQITMACEEAFSRIGTERFILSPGCVIPHNTPAWQIETYCSSLSESI